MDQQEHVQERRERKGAAGREEDRDADQRRKDLQDPGEVVVRPDGRPDQNREKDDDERRTQTHYFFLLDFRLDFLLDFLLDFRDGTFPPSRRASESPMAMACLRLVTFLPEPLFSVPRLRSCIAFSTFSCDFFPYFEAMR